MRSVLRLSAIVLVCCADPYPVQAHHLDYTLATAKFGRDESFNATLQFHVAAYVLNEEPGLLTDDAMARVRAMGDEELQSKIELARQSLADGLVIQFDEQRWRAESFEFPTVQEIRDDALATQPQPSPPVTFVGRLPDGARTFTAIFPPRLGKVMLNLESNGAPTNVQILRPGEQSWPYLMSADADDIVERVPNSWLIGWAYFRLGFEHILPKGLDHILFVLGLFLLNQSWRALLLQVTAFTVAHSVTLALSMYHVVSLPAQVVEPLIALSIAYVAIENICTSTLKPWRPVVVFIFGLLHGLGFAGVLRELGVPSDDALLALVTFNVGVEFGQLAVIGLAFLVVGWFRNRSWYRQVVVIPASCVIAFVGVYWTAERILQSTSLAAAFPF